jgi:L-asparaginase
MSRIAVVFTGGTISMVVDSTAGGAVPALDGAAILARTPGLEQFAEVVPVDRGMIPASHWTFERLLELAADLRRLAADPTIDGMVVVQGTDTIEESSFAFELLVDTAKPIVVTGAMRSATDPGYDGPANLRDAVRCAADSRLGGAGVVVVLAGTIEPAADVTKTHASALDTFRSLNQGRLGRLADGALVLERPPSPRRAVLDTRVAAGPVPIVVATIGLDVGLIGALRSLRPAGIVVEATGAGNTAASLLAEALAAIRDGIPVVLASRCPSGAAAAGYAFPGGGATWVKAGALLAGTLTGPKARIALSLALGAGLGGSDLGAFLAGPESGVRPPASDRATDRGRTSA